VEWTKETMQQVVEKVANRSKTDLAFRKELVDHPHRAIQEATGAIVPDSVGLKFVDKTTSQLTIILPDPEIGQDELSEKQLEAVAGGKGSSSVTASDVEAGLFYGSMIVLNSISG